MTASPDHYQLSGIRARYRSPANTSVLQYFYLWISPGNCLSAFPGRKAGLWIMAVIRCKICGGDLNITDGTTVAVCEYCGTRQTLPKINDEQRAAAFNRGDHFRKISEFDKALSVYERIIAEDDTDAEAHWCAALSRYGIEYVKDPASGKYIPTCHRASFTNFLEDVDYQAAVANADPVAREQYEHDGRIIAEVQRNIIETVNKEAPFDVFICYKESDERGQRTLDSTLAQDIYYRLTDQGYRVFFSRITLEDKAGQQYEPYIFAALHSAKVMIVIGTRPEYMNAVWVKNEWSRFLAFMKNDRSRLLIPCYRDMDPYDMPEQLSVLQSYDMSRIGFIQDLIRGISKVLELKTDEEKEEKSVQEISEQTNFNALLRRGNIELQDMDFSAADICFDKALDFNPESSEAYIGKLLAFNQCKNIEELIEKSQNLINNSKIQQITVPRNMKDIDLVAEKYAIEKYLDSNTIRKLFNQYEKSFSSKAASLSQRIENETEKLNSNKYLNRAIRFANKNDFIINAKNRILTNWQLQLEKEQSKDVENYKRITEEYSQEFFESYEKANQLYQATLQKRESDYQLACSQADKAEKISDCDTAIFLFEEIGTGYKDINDRIDELHKRKKEIYQAEQIRLEQQEKSKKIKEYFVLLIVILIMSLILLIAINSTK